MKTLNEIEDDITVIKNNIFQNEIGNDMYYSSPAYHKNLIRLEALEHEANVLKGKFSPSHVGFEGYDDSKKCILQQLAEQNGQWFADSYRHYEDEALKSVLKMD